MTVNIVGHDENIALFRQLVRDGRLPHAILLAGPEGVGKKLAALFLAQLTLCRASRGKPCGVCEACRKIESRNHPDLLDVPSEEKTRLIRIETIRSEKARVQLKPHESDRRVVIIEHAERMNDAAQNALLKVLEEPPGATIFVLITSEPGSLRPTVLSRLRKFRFGALPRDVEEKLLREKFTMNAEDAKTFAAWSQGSLARAQELREGDVPRIRNEILDRLLAQESGVPSPMTSWEVSKDEAPRVLEVLMDLCRDLLVLKVSPSTERLVHSDRVEDLKRLSARWSADQVLDLLQVLGQAREDVERLANVKLVLLEIWQRLGIRFLR